MSDRNAFHFRATSAGLPGVELAVRSFGCTEALDHPYELTASVSITDDDADPMAMLGRDFVLVVERESGETRRWAGVAKAVTHGAENLSEAGGVLATVEVVPAFALLDLRINTRIFQDQDALEIAAAVLGEGLGAFSREVDVAATGPFPKREYCVQYQESDFAFVSRLLEEEGVAYSFAFDGEREVLTLTDENAQLQAIEPILFRADERTAGDRPFVDRFARRSAATTTSVVVRDFDFTGPSAPEAEARDEDAAGRDRESYEHGVGENLTIGDYAGTRYGAEDSTRQARLRQEMHLGRVVTVQGTGRAILMSAGRRFDLSEHPIVGIDDEYIVTRVEHGGTASRRGGRVETTYENSFACVPSAPPYRPLRRTRKPRVSSLEAAVVTGPSGEEIHTDEHGRVKVQLHWDREGQLDDHTTCWMRVRQTWAGEGWGFVFIPRIGMEVVVGFLDGDPDRPLVTGCVYDGANAPPYALPDEKTKSTIKTQSSPGKPDGYNELRFEDAAGQEQIYTQAEKDQNEDVLANHTTTVGGDQDNIVGKTQTQLVHVNQTERITGDQTMTVGETRSVHVKGAFHEKIQAHEKREVDGGVTETVLGFEKRTVSGGMTETITGSELRGVGAKLHETITGPHTQTVNGASLELLTAGSTQTVVAGPIAYDTAGTMTMTSTGAIALNGLAGIQMQIAGPVTQTTDWDLKWKTVKDTVKASKVEPSGTSISLYGAKVGIYGATDSWTAIKIGLFAHSVSHAAAKFSAYGMKIGIAAKKDELKGVNFAPLKFKVTL